MDCCDNLSTNAFPFGSEGVFPFNLGYAPSVVDNFIPSFVELHMVGASWDQQEARRQNGVQKHPMAYAQQQALFLQSQSQELSQTIMAYCAQQVGAVHTGQLQLHYPLQQFTEIDGVMTRAVEHVQAAQDIIQS